MMIRRILALAVLAVLSTPAFSQDAPTITVRKGDRVPVAVTPLGGSSGPAVTKVLQNDLDLSGWFQLVPDSRGSYVIGGSASGGSLQGRVTDGSGAVVLSKTYSGDDRSVAHQFADDIVETLTGHPGIATTKVAFVGTASGAKEIYLADYDGNNSRRLTSDRSISVAPSLGPGARNLAYTGYQGGYPDVYVIDVASGARQRAVSAPGTNSGAAVSPDGGRMALTMSKDGNPEIYVTGLRGGGAKRLTRTKGVEASPAWSPDGRELIYSSDEGGSPQLYRIGAGGGSPRRLNTGFGYNTDPSWSPDGKRVAFTVRSGGGFSVAVMDAEGGNARIVASGQNPVWGRNSRHLIFSSGSSLNLLDLNTGRTTTIVSGLGKVSEPTWSH
ncbi:MAG: PD40 domain-containing protein [Chthoniobacterales bacterium]|nr:PD40 domain-containing protein [Chthoniobacterales bacterium]